MDVAEFEQNILKLAFETDVRITTASVSYYLGIPSTKVGPMLEELLERGVLELDSDAEGNLYYRVIDAADRQSYEAISKLKQERLNGIDGGTGESTKGSSKASDGPGGRRGSVVGGATPEGDDDVEPISPRRGKAHTEQASSEPTRTHEPSGSVGRGPVVGRSTSASADDASANRRAKVRADDTPKERRPTATRTADGRGGTVDDLFAGVTSHRAAMDASLDSCGDKPVVVQSKVRCAPNPFADSDPILASCSDGMSRQSTGMVRRSEQSTGIGHVRQQQNTMPATAGASAATMYRREDHLEKPEHQPGMSLLLSLILCGTRQIYNGEVSKGIMMMVLCFLLWFVLLGWVVHIWSIVDSVVVAERINRTSGNN